MEWRISRSEVGLGCCLSDSVSPSASVPENRAIVPPPPTAQPAVGEMNATALNPLESSFLQCKPPSNDRFDPLYLTLVGFPLTCPASRLRGIKGGAALAIRGRASVPPTFGYRSLLLRV